MKKVVSVIIPVYNVENYLKDCVDSVVSQTAKNIEIILVDDGSTDSSGELCDKIAKTDRRIAVFHKKNGGLSDARNFGLNYANGEYIVFIDSDDVVDKCMIEKLYDMVSENKCDIGIIDPAHFYDSAVPNYVNVRHTEILDSSSAICTMLYQKKFLVSATGKIYKKQLFDSIKFPVGMIFEDIAIMYKLFDICRKVAYNSSKLYGYRHRNGSITTNGFSARDLDILQICDEMTMYFEKSNNAISRAVKCYTLNANFRVYLNCYNNSEYAIEKEKCAKYIKNNCNDVLFNFKTRLKLKIAILLFIFNKKLMVKMYSKIDRWK